MKRQFISDKTRAKLDELDRNRKAWNILGLAYLLILLPLLIWGFVTIRL